MLRFTKVLNTRTAQRLLLGVELHFLSGIGSFSDCIFTERQSLEHLLRFGPHHIEQCVSLSVAIF